MWAETTGPRLFSTMLMRYSTLPTDAGILQRFQDIRREAFPLLPFSPEPGTEDAGWLIGPDEDPVGYVWLRRQPGKRGLLDLHTPAEFLADCWQVIRKQAAAWELGRLVAHVPENDENAHRSFDALDFTPFGQILPMTGRVPANASLPETEPNLYLRSYSDLGHLPTLSALLHRAYHDLPGRPEYETDGVTVETVRAEIEGAGVDIRPDYFLVLNDYGKGVGVVRCRSEGWIDGPGIVPDARKGALHQALLAAALHRLAAEGVETARLVVYDPVDRWVHDYETAGFLRGTPRTIFHRELDE